MSISVIFGSILLLSAERASTQEIEITHAYVYEYSMDSELSTIVSKWKEEGGTLLVLNLSDSLRRMGVDRGQFLLKQAFEPAAEGSTVTGVGGLSRYLFYDTTVWDVQNPFNHHPYSNHLQFARRRDSFKFDFWIIEGDDYHGRSGCIGVRALRGAFGMMRKYYDTGKYAVAMVRFGQCKWSSEELREPDMIVNFQLSDYMPTNLKLVSEYLEDFSPLSDSAFGNPRGLTRWSLLSDPTLGSVFIEETKRYSGVDVRRIKISKRE